MWDLLWVLAWAAWSVWEMFWWLVDVISCAITTFACDWLKWCTEKGMEVLDVVLATVPAPPVLDSWLVDDFGAGLLYWFPMTWVVTWWASYGVWKVAFLTYRMVKNISR